MSLTLDTAELEQRIVQAVAQRVEAIVTRVLDGNGHTKGGDRWMPLAEVAKRVGRSKRTVNDWSSDGRFPKQAVVWGGMKMWRESDVERWVADREKAGSV